MTTFTASDKLIIERVRRAQRYRRPLGAICLILGLIGMSFIFYWLHEIDQQSAAIADWLAKSTTRNTQQIAQPVEWVQHYIGFTFGLGMGASLVAAVSCATNGLILLLVPNRKDRLLLKLCDGQPIS